VTNEVLGNVVKAVIEEMKGISVQKKAFRSMTRVCHSCHSVSYSMTSMTRFDKGMTSEFEGYNTLTIKKNRLRHSMTDFSFLQLIQGDSFLWI